MTGGCLESKSGEPNEVEAGHGAREGPKEAAERALEVERARLLPVDVSRDHRYKRRSECQSRRTSRNREGDPGYPPDTEQVDDGKNDPERSRQDRDRDPGHEPLLNGGGRQDRQVGTQPHQ